jgi:transcriptional regulator GlxA family with amidase domain
MADRLRTAIDSRVPALARAIANDLGRQWTVPEMAALLGITAGQLRRVVKQAENATPRQWLCNLRLEQAARMLVDPSVRIKEIQQRVGILDASHFARDFRDRFGTSPSEYRGQRAATDDSLDSHARSGQQIDE